MASIARAQENRPKPPEAPAEIRELLDNDNFEGVENAFIARLEKAAGDIDFFIGTLGLLIKRRRIEQADTLFDLLLDNLGGPEKADALAPILKTCLQFWPDNKSARSLLLTHMRGRYGRSPNFERFVEHCNYSNSRDPLAALECIERWVQFDEGQAVYMPTKGIGRIKEVNLTLETVRADIAGSGGKLVSMRITEAGRVLESLAAGHFLRDKLENLDALKEIANKDPGEILRRLFTSIGRPLSAGEIKEMVVGVVDVSRWNTWWNKAKTDPRLVAGQGARALCSWNESAQKADEGLAVAFEKASLREKLAMVRTYADRSGTMSGMMSQALEAEARNAQKSNPALALEIMLAQLKYLPDTEVRGDGLKEILAREDIASLILGIEEKNLRRLAVTQVEKHRTDVRDIYHFLMRRESDAQILAAISASLERIDNEGFSTAVRSIIATPGTAPGFFVWMCREIPRRGDMRQFAGYQLLRSVLAMLSDASQKEYHSALRSLFNPGEAAHVAVGNLEHGQASELLSILDRDVGLESFRKEELRRDIRATYPAVAESPKNTFLVTERALEQKRSEFIRIVKQDLPHNAIEIKKAREFGDLSENFEYHAARARQELLSSRAKTLEDELGSARILKREEIDISRVGAGSRVRLEPVSGDGGIVDMTILGPWDSDPAKNILSYLAPSVADMLGKKPGENCMFNDICYRVGSIGLWEDESP